MKIFAAIILIFIFLFAIGIAGIITISSFISKQALAESYSPLDFLSDYDKFEVRVGIDNEYGRYYSYHYEFSE
jgi:hypothetical protein